VRGGGEPTVNSAPWSSGDGSIYPERRRTAARTRAPGARGCDEGSGEALGARGGQRAAAELELRARVAHGGRGLNARPGEEESKRGRGNEVGEASR